MKKKLSELAREALINKKQYDTHVTELKEKYPPKKIASPEEGGKAIVQRIKELKRKLNI